MRTEARESWADRARRILAQRGRQTGAAREALLNHLADQSCALSVVEIEEALRAGGRSVGRASIYRILDELERLGLVQKVEVGQAMARYEPALGRDQHHHHLVCDECGTVIPFADPGLEKAITELSGRVPMAVTEHEIVLHGACRSCAP